MKRINADYYTEDKYVGYREKRHKVYGNNGTLFAYGIYPTKIRKEDLPSHYVYGYSSGGYRYHFIDKHLRTEHISWWSQEDITNHDVDNAIWNLKRYNNKLDFVLTHCVDSQTVKDAFHFRSNKSTDQLMFVDKVVNYKKWFFGHYHFDVTISKQKECIYQRIINLNRL